MIRELYSFVFYLVFIVYIMFGIYIYNINKKSALNLTFLGVCISMAIWSFSFAIIRLVESYETALIVKRFGAMGWGTMYSFLLHFSMVLTEKKKYLKKKWFYAVIYTPAIINIYVFGLSSAAYKHHGLVFMNGDWIGIPADRIWDNYFNVYYLVFSVTAIWVIWRWGKHVQEAVKRAQAKLIVRTVIIALLIGSFTDKILKRYYDESTLQIAPAIALISIAAIFFSIKKHGFMKTAKVKDVAEEGRILSEAKRVKLFYYIGGVFVLGSILNWINILFFWRDKTSLLTFSIVLLVLGVILLVLPGTEIKELYQENIMIAIVSMSIPATAFRFAGADVGNTSWPISLMLLGISTILNKRTMFWSVSIVTMATLLVSFYIATYAYVDLGPAEHLSRITIFGIGIVLSYYLNNIYIRRLEDSNEQKKVQKIISEISADFAMAEAENWDLKLDTMLETLGKYFNSDRTCLAIDSESQEESLFIKRWVKSEQSSCPEEYSYKIEAPIKSKGRKTGQLSIEFLKEKINLKEYQKDMVSILANLMGNTAAKIESERDTAYMAYYDPLTSLPNRRLFKKHLEKITSESAANADITGVILIDLDSFKYVNDTIGHEGGDKLLKYVSRKLEGVVRKGDMVSRFGGDEFTIALSKVRDLEHLAQIADRIVSEVKKPIVIEGHEFFVTASAGIALYPGDGLDAETLIKNSDLAMYESKKTGKNRWTLCSPQLKGQMEELTELTNSLHRVVERDELILHYQPQVCIESEKIVGMEALIRWNHPEKGLIPPSMFIPIAEQSDLIKEIGTWVMKEAFSQSKKWQDQGIEPMRIAINLSIKQLYSKDFSKIIKKELMESGLDPKYVEVEVTESIASIEGDKLDKVLKDIKDMGISISIDDFGMEYSSFKRLKQMPIDRVKIDKYFIDGISRSQKDEAIIRGMVYLTNALDLKIIAEGVEERHQLEFLRKTLCDEIQGYYYYKPMPADEMEKILK